MKYYSLLILFLFSLFSYGQKEKKYPKKIDSLKKVIHLNNDPNLNDYNTLCAFFQANFKLDSLNLYLKKYEFFATQNNDSKHIGISTLLRGVHFALQSKLDSALIYFKAAYKTPNLPERYTIISLGNISQAYTILEQKDSAIAYLKKNLSLAKRSNSKKYLAGAYNSMYNFYATKNLDYKLSLKYIDSAYEIVRNNPSKDLRRQRSSISHHLGSFAMEIEDYESAKGFYLKSLKIYKELNSLPNIFQTNLSLSDVFLELNKIDSAKYYAYKNLKHTSIHKDRMILVRTYRRIGNILNVKKKYRNAINYYDKGLKIASKNLYDYNVLLCLKANSLFNLGDITNSNIVLNKIKKKHIDSYITLEKGFYGLKNKIFSHSKNIDSSNYFKEKLLLVNDSIFNAKKTKIIASLQAKYETQQKENKILKQQNELQQKEIALQKGRQKTNFALAGLVILILGGGLYFRKRKRDEKIRLLHQNISSSEEERQRIGRDLHDGVASNLLRLVQDVEVKNIGLSHKILASYNEIRQLSHQLNSTPMHGEVFVDRVFDIIPQSTTKKEYNLQLSPTYLELEEPLGTHLYRIIQELIANDNKHSNASKVTIAITKDEHTVFLNYKDNGTISNDLKEGNGLKNIKTRIALLKGSITLKTTNGFQLVIEIPLKIV